LVLLEMELKSRPCPEETLKAAAPLDELLSKTE
jgi:hypothetical protein